MMEKAKAEVEKFVNATTKLNVALEFLSQYADADVQMCAREIKESLDRKTRILQLVQEAIAQLKLDVSYLGFDLQCTRNERDAALAKLANGPFGEPE
jgi:uncharacterized protein (UPF0210 family)